MRPAQLISEIPARLPYVRKATSANLKPIAVQHLEVLRRHEEEAVSIGAAARLDVSRALVIFEYAPESGAWRLNSIPLRDMSPLALLLLGIPESIIDASIDLVRNYDIDATFPVLVKRMLGERCLDGTLTEIRFPDED